jgi:hypothetical protein
MKKSTKKAAPKKAAAPKKPAAKKSAAKKSVAKKSPPKKAAIPKKSPAGATHLSTGSGRGASPKKAPKGRAIPTRGEATGKGRAIPTRGEATGKTRAIPTRAKGAGTKKPAAKSPPAKRTTAKIPPSPKSPAPRRPKKFAATEPTRGYGFPDGAPELPENYGEDRLVLMTKDPEYLFAYWEITPGLMAEGEKAKHPGSEYREAMRLNWAARDLFEPNYALLPVSLEARKWYLRVPRPGVSYQMELGWISDQGHFIALLGSNPSDAPESWTATRRRLKAGGEGNSVLEYSLRVTQPLGSSGLGTVESVPKQAPLVNPDFGAPGSAESSPGARGGSGPRG